MPSRSVAPPYVRPPFRSYLDDIELHGRKRWSTERQSEATLNIMRLEALVPATTGFKVPLDRCANLAVAGTGSGTLFTRLATLRRDLNSPITDNQTRHVHDGYADSSDDKLNQIGNITRLARAEFDGRACFILSVRDPVARIQSGIRYDATNECNPDSYWAAMLRLLRCIQTVTSGLTLDPWATALRNTSHPYHDSVVKALVPRVGVNGMPLPKTGASNFFVPQVEYLRGLTPCGLETEVHFMCTEKLDAAWDELKRRTGIRAEVVPSDSPTVYNPDLLMVTNNSVHRRFDAGGSKRSYFPPYADVASGDYHHDVSRMHGWRLTSIDYLSDANAAFIRNELFGMDARLHHLLCRGEPKGLRSFVTKGDDCNASAEVDRVPAHQHRLGRRRRRV